MSTKRNFQLADLQAFLSESERQDHDLRFAIGSKLTSPHDRMLALLELAQLSSDLTALVMEAIKAESIPPEQD